MKSEVRKENGSTMLKIRISAATESLFSTARKVQRIYGLGDGDLVVILALLLDWYDPQGMGDYFQPLDVADVEWKEEPCNDSQS